MVRAAYAQAPPRARSQVAGARMRTTVALAAATLLLAVLALTPAGATVGGWIGDVVDSGSGSARPVLQELPAPGRLIVQAREQAWIVQADGARRRLGRWTAATWSPGGLFVAAARARTLAALDPHGRLRWSLLADGPVSQPRWSPDGYRVAYRSGEDLRVVAGDGSGDHLLARGAEYTAPAWRPGRRPGEQQLAYAVGVHVLVVAADSGRVIGRTRAEMTPQELWWTRDGRRLIAVSKGQVLVHDARGRLLRSVRAPRGLRFEGSALAPDGRRLALLAPRQDGLSSELLLLRVDRRAVPPRRAFVGPGFYEGLAWAPNGRVLALASVGTDRWLFVRAGRRTSAVGRIRAQFGPGARPAAWCYPEPSSHVIRTFTSCSAPGAEPR